jgi:(R,R)-butanediol dehydrogenase/meso-butanediol dehydrogenase/diacetyl reductase
VVDIAGAAPGIRIGDRVAVDGCIKCGECWYCTHGNYVLCDKLAILGFDAHGGFAERVAAPTYALHKLPDTISGEVGAVIEPLSVVTHAVRKGRVAPGDIVTVVGAGMIGLGTLQVARAAGAAAVFVVEKIARRRQRALAMGATAVIDPEHGDAVAQIRELTAGHGADIAFDCVGTEGSVNSALALARKGGRVVIVGVFKSPPTVDLNKVVLEEREIYGCLAYVDDFPRAIALVADGRLDAEAFVTKRIALDDIIEEGFQQLLDDPTDQIRIVVDTKQG